MLHQMHFPFDHANHSTRRANDDASSEALDNFCGIGENGRVVPNVGAWVYVFFGGGIYIVPRIFPMVKSVWQHEKWRSFYGIQHQFSSNEIHYIIGLVLVPQWTCRCLLIQCMDVLSYLYTGNYWDIYKSHHIINMSSCRFGNQDLGRLEGLWPIQTAPGFGVLEALQPKQRCFIAFWIWYPLRDHVNTVWIGGVESHMLSI